MSYNKHVSQPLIYPDFVRHSPDLGAGHVPIMPVQNQVRKQPYNNDKENLNNRDDY